jgi:hypothetical protein
MINDPVSGSILRRNPEIAPHRPGALARAVYFPFEKLFHRRQRADFSEPSQSTPLGGSKWVLTEEHRALARALQPTARPARYGVSIARCPPEIGQRHFQHHAT